MSQGIRRGDWLRGARAEMHADDVQFELISPPSPVVETVQVNRLSMPLALSGGLIPPAMLMSSGQTAMSTLYAS